MTVELERPFRWPEEPEDYKPWNKREVEDSEASVKGLQERQGSTGDAVVETERRERMREQAKALLEGREKWKPMKFVSGSSGEKRR